MEKIIKYKEQGNGTDSWEISEVDKKGELLNRYMVYEDPSIEKKIDLSNIDIDTLPEEELNKLIIKLKQKLNL